MPRPPRRASVTAPRARAVTGPLRHLAQIGASSVHVLDLRKDFLETYVFPALQCNAIYEGRYLLGTSLARPCIAKHAV